MKNLLEHLTKHEPVHLLRLPRQAEPDHHRPERLVQADALEVEVLQEKSQHLLDLGVVLFRMIQSTTDGRTAAKRTKVSAACSLLTPYAKSYIDEESDVHIRSDVMPPQGSCYILYPE